MSKIPRSTRCAGLGLGLLLLVGCAASQEEVLVPSPAPLGAEIDQMMVQQEQNAEASKFVIPMHEFELNRTTKDGSERGWRLNEYGEDHVKQIAASLRAGHDFPVVVERSQTTPFPETQYKFPIHFNEDLDLKRRTVVVAVLERMGVLDADQRVVVSPAFAEGFTATEAARAFNKTTMGNGQSGSGSGGGGSGGNSGGNSGGSSGGNGAY